jgi:hypothetical protein
MHRIHQHPGGGFLAAIKTGKPSSVESDQAWCDQRVLGHTRNQVNNDALKRSVIPVRITCR